MYQVKIYHYRPCTRNGDLEDEQIMLDSKVFKTRKEAKEFIESKLRNKKDVFRNYHRGNVASWCGYLTGYKWVHENSGETCYEEYSFEMIKI